MHERTVASSSTAARFVRSIVAALAMLSIPGFAGPAFAVTFTVDSTADVDDATPGDGTCATAAAECTLRAALAEVFFFTGGTTVGGEIDLPAGNYVLNPPVSYQSYSSVALHGAGAATTTITGLSLVQLLMQASVLIEKVTLVTGGVFTTQGGAGATLRFVDAVVASPDVQSKNNTFIIFERSTLTDVDLYADDTSTVRLTDSAATGGKIQGGVKGRFFLVNSSFTDGDGATIPLGSRLECTDSVISGHSGAGVDVASSGTLVGTRCEISDNDGAGLEMTIGNTTQVTFADGLIAGNRGGGVNCNGGNHGIWTITNSTIDGNTKTGNGAGLFVSGDIVTLTLINVTITNNVATGAGGGIFIESFTNGSDCSAAETTISGVLLAGNGSTAGQGPDCLTGCSALQSAGNNLIGDLTDCTVTGDTASNLSGDPMVGPLQDNGGPTFTRALLAGSPAINAGGGCALSADQRGVLRPQGAACDIGAFEYACGNGTIDLGETCDGGNAVDGDCCSANCIFEPNGAACPADTNACTDDVCDGAGTCGHPANTAPCNDGNDCTTGDLCNGGTCGVGTPVVCNACESCVAGSGCVAAPRPLCHQPTARISSPLQIVDKTSDKLAWTWSKGAATTLTEFGDLRGDDTLALCLFDESGPTPQVKFRARTRTGQCGKRPCWKALGANTLRYKDPAQTPDGLDTVMLKGGADGKAKILLTGKGAHLTPPTLPLGLPFRMQLQAENGQCWEARYFELGTVRNDLTQLKSKAFQP